ncbi:MULTISPECIES: alpha-hydroxy acid oxidase [Roseobacteraceae]|uniref:alpha-hydroxy acid oxidase n=1 Tax=Roseobacteraceae TaxID=2854170 RepID=UPI004057D78B
MFRARIANVADLERRARQRMPRFAYNYLTGGAGDSASTHRNRRALQQMVFATRRLVGADIRTEVTLFGQEYSAPLGVAPLGMANVAWPGLDLMLARSAREAKLPFVLSTMATTTIEAAAEAAEEFFWFQLYIAKSDEITFGLIERAREAGTDVLVLTVDVPAPSRRNASIRDGFELPLRYTPRLLADLALHPRWSIETLLAGAPLMRNYAAYAKSENTQKVGAFAGKRNKFGTTWDDFKRIREAWQGRLVIKGISNGEDAARAVREGADAVWVSNHGGRQLESSPATVDLLPAVRAATPDNVPVFFDGGVRGGEDIVKGTALGADMVFAGRSFAYAGAAGGQAATTQCIEILIAEMRSTMAQIGLHSPEALRSAPVFFGQEAERMVPGKAAE